MSKVMMHWLKGIFSLTIAFTFLAVTNGSTAAPKSFEGLLLEKEQYETEIPVEDHQVQHASERKIEPPGEKQHTFSAATLSSSLFILQILAEDSKISKRVAGQIPFARPPLFILHHSWKLDIC